MYCINQCQCVWHLKVSSVYICNNLVFIFFPEKEAYLQGFTGSNELDLPFRGDKINKRTSGGTTAVQLAGRRVRHTNCSTEDSSSPPLQMDTQQNVEGSPSVVTAPSQNGTDRCRSFACMWIHVCWGRRGTFGLGGLFVIFKLHCNGSWNNKDQTFISIFRH